MPPRPEENEQILAETQVEQEDVTHKEIEDASDKKDATAKDESHSKQEEEDNEEDKAEENKEPKLKTAEEIRMAFDPFSSSENDEAQKDKISQEAADAAKELANLLG